jgi:hypothetical protein
MKRCRRRRQRRLYGDRKFICSDLREGGFRALALRAETAEDGDKATWIDCDSCRLVSRQSHRWRLFVGRTRLDVHRESDTNRAAFLPQFALPVAQRGVVNLTDEVIEAFREAVLLVEDARRSYIREIGTADHVLSSNSNGIEPDSGCDNVHHPLDDEVPHLHPKATEGAVGCLVGGDAGNTEVAISDPVGPGEQINRVPHGVPALDCPVGAHVRQNSVLHGQYLAVVRNGELHLVELVSGMARTDEILGSALYPLHGSTENHGGSAYCNFLPVDPLVPEGASDFGHNHPDVVLRERQHIREQEAISVNSLAGNRHRQLLRDLVETRQDLAAL